MINNLLGHIEGYIKEEHSGTERLEKNNRGKVGIAEIKLFINKEVSVIEIERETKSLSTLISFLDKQENKIYAYQQILKGLINANGAWDKEQLQINNIDLLILRHGKKDMKHRVRIMFNKFR